MKYEVEVKFQNDFIKVEGNSIVVGLKSKPEKGRANMELIKKLAKHFKVHASQVKIVSGLTSRKKIVEVIENDSMHAVKKNPKFSEDKQ